MLFPQSPQPKTGFTFIEVMVVFTIIIMSVGAIFVTFDPISRFQDKRDAKRWQDVSNLVTAIKLNYQDNKNEYIDEVKRLEPGYIYMIGNGNDNCDIKNPNCDTNVTKIYCVDLTGLVTENYLKEIPLNPNGNGEWSSQMTGYTIQLNANKTITIRSCESENTSSIEINR